MAFERGLPSIPRGLGRELTTYLQAEQAVLLRLSGLTRGAETSRAIRVSDGSATIGTATASIGQGSITTRHLADNTVSSAKIVDGAITETKFAQSSVTERAIRAGAVTEDALAAGAVTASKIAEGVLPVFFTGEATDGETITVPGVWAAAPAVMLSSFSCPWAAVAGDDMDTEAPRIGATDLHELSGTEGKWEFTAAGNFSWVAIGYAR